MIRRNSRLIYRIVRLQLSMQSNYAITFACYNQLAYTQQFIASLDRDEVDFTRIVAVDNGSTDGTREWLLSQGFGQVILNNRNLGCGAAWNQGALAIQSKWTVVMNNDVVCARGWLNKLLASAERHQLQIASPAMVEGEFDYDLEAWSKESSEKMNGYCRVGAPHAVCMAIREDVWDEIGYFLPVPKLLGYEDGIFFQRANEKNIKTGTVSDAWLHHFGMTTQNALKLEKKMERRESLGDRSLMRLYMGLGWWKTKLGKLNKRILSSDAQKFELQMFDKTIHGINHGSNKGWDWL